MILKRIFDITIVIISLPLWLPLLMILFIFSFFDIHSYPIFFQKRGGFRGKIITIYKLKTMNNLKDIDGNLLDDKYRITKIGGFFRKLSLDELPSLINVLKGDMSLVGPRPFIADYLPLYSEQQMRRHLVKPGITGWAQVNGRNAISWEDKFKLDIWYVENQSLWLDIKILFLTLKKVLIQDGISAEGEATMPRFTGSKKL
jgi:lipopolysaccharide/colanic/teichoic acid biosynthesis glycosyltransferase